MSKQTSIRKIQEFNFEHRDHGNKREEDAYTSVAIIPISVMAILFSSLK